MVRRLKIDANEAFTDEMLKKDPRTWMSKMKKLIRASHEREQGCWSLENEVKSEQELTDDVVNYFQGISNHFTPLDRSKLNITPPNAPFVSEVPCFSEDYELYELVKGAKKTFSVPDDIPPKILPGMLPHHQAN